MSTRFDVRLDVAMAILGVFFLGVVLAQLMVNEESPIESALEIAGWVLWSAFIAEFLLRMAIAPSSAAYLRRNWWQIPLLIVPFLRFVRLLHLLRPGGLDKVISSTLRAGRSTARAIGDRMAGTSGRL
jgi:voltage-gated potassium channel